MYAHPQPTRIAAGQATAIYSGLYTHECICIPSLPLQDEGSSSDTENSRYVRFLGVHLIRLRCLVAFLHSNPKCPFVQLSAVPQTARPHLQQAPFAISSYPPVLTFLRLDLRMSSTIECSVRFMFLAYCMCMARSTYFKYWCRRIYRDQPLEGKRNADLGHAYSWLKLAAPDERSYILPWALGLLRSLGHLSVF